MRVVYLALLALLVTAGAEAQNPQPAASAGVIVGAGQTWDDEGSLGSGIVAGARFGHRLFGRTGVELSVDVLRHDRDVGYFQAEGTTTLFGATLVQRFGGGSVQPYLLAGGFIARHSGTVRFADAPEFDNRSTNPGIALGGGVAFMARRQWEIGPELRVLGMQPDDDSDPAMAYWVGLRVVYRF